MNYLSLARRLRGLFTPRERARLAVIVLMMTVGAAFEALSIGLILPFIAILNSPALIHENTILRRAYELTGVGGANQFLLGVGCLLLVVFIVKNIYLGLVTYLSSNLIFNKQAALSRDLLEHYLRQPYTFHLQKNSAQLQSNVVNEIGRLTSGVLLPLLALLAEFLVMLFIVGLLLAIDPFVTVITIATTGLVALLIQSLLRSALTRLGEQRTYHAGLLIKAVHHALGGVKEAKIHGREVFFLDAYDRNSRGYVRTARLFTTLNTLPRLLIETLIVGGMLIVIITLLAQGGDLQKALPLLALFGMSAVRIMPSLTRMIAASNNVRFNYSALDAIDVEALAASVARTVPEIPFSAPPAAPTSLHFSTLELRDIGFRYPDVNLESLAGISLRIDRGQSIGIVGASGAGKSTLVDLILGLLEPFAGFIRVGGHELRAIRTEWQRMIGYVPQSIYLLDDSIRRNVAFGLEDGTISDARVWEALKAARLDDRIRNLPSVLDTAVGERGVRLSGGERQRIGIARALYHQPEILVFDEATSALDNQTEREIADTIDTLSGEKTVIIVAHRLTTVKHCQCIYFMNRGRIADAGTYDELLARNAEFRSMAQSAS